MVTKKIYVEKVVPILQKKAKAVLAGHKIQPAIIKMVQTRPDVCAKLAVFAFNTINWKKGDKALRKNDQFKISGYKNYMDFSKRSMGDIAKFQETLPLKDKKSFLVNENVVTFLIVPDVATNDMSSDIVTLKSTMLTYGRSLDRAYAGLGGIFITIAFGESYILPKNAKRAEMKEKINKKVNTRKTTAKVKQELVRKNKEKLAKLKAQGAEYKSEGDRLAMQLQELQGLDAELGGGAKIFDEKIKTEIKSTVAELSPTEKKMYADIAKYRAEGKNAIADAIEADFKANSDKSILVNTPKSSAEILAERKAGHDKSIEKLELSSDALNLKIANATNAKEKSAFNYALRQNMAKIEALKAKINVHGSANKLGVTIEKKRAMLTRINEKMELNVLAGMSIKDAMNSAVATSNIDKETVAEISTDLKAEVASGLTQEEAIIEVITNAVEDSVTETTTTIPTNNSRVKINDGTAFNGMKVFEVDGNSTVGYSYSTKVWDIENYDVDAEYFAKEENAITFVKVMNESLGLNDVKQYPQVAKYNVEDGMVANGQKVFAVVTLLEEGEKYEYFETTYDSTLVDSSAIFFIDETNAFSFVLKNNQQFVDFPTSYKIEDGEVFEGDFVFGVSTEDERYIKEEYVFKKRFDKNNAVNSPNEIYFIDEENAKTYAIELKNTLYPTPTVVNSITLNDGEANDGDIVYMVEQDYVTSNYEYTEVVLDVNNIDVDMEYFVSEENAKEHAEQMTELYLGDEASGERYTINDGEVKEGDSVFYVFMNETGVYVSKPINFIHELVESDEDNEIFIDEATAQKFADDMNATLTVDETFTVNDGVVMDGDRIFGVELDIPEGDEYEHFASTYNPNSPNKEVVYFINEKNAIKFADDMNATLGVSQPATQQNSVDDINDILAFL